MMACIIVKLVILNHLNLKCLSSLMKYCTSFSIFPSFYINNKLLEVPEKEEHRIRDDFPAFLILYSLIRSCAWTHNDIFIISWKHNINR